MTMLRCFAFVLRHVDPHGARKRGRVFEIMIDEGCSKGQPRLVGFSDHLREYLNSPTCFVDRVVRKNSENDDGDTRT